MSVTSLAFPYKQTEASPIFLNKLILTNEEDSFRYVVTLVESELGKPGERTCSSITKIKSDTQIPTGELITYIQNPSPTKSTPLLVSIPPTFNRFKLNISIRTSTLTEISTKSLIILKTLADNDDINGLQRSLDEKGSYNSHRVEISRLPYENFPISKDSPHEFQKIIINDTFSKSIFQDNKLNVSIWEVNDKSGGHNHLFSFKLWVNEVDIQLTEDANTNSGIANQPPAVPPKEPITVPQAVASKLTTQPHPASQTSKAPPAPVPAPAPIVRPPSSPSSDKLTMPNIRSAFTFNIEDGPEFRQSLQVYEKNIPLFRRNCYSLLDELKRLDANLERITTSKARIIECLSNISDLQAFSPLLAEINFKKDFKRRFVTIFEAFETDLKSFLVNVCDHKLLLKVLSNLPSDASNSSSSSSSSAAASTTSPGDLAKKQFESNSKDYYNWLNKYLSNEKERPVSKLLVKRKTFELSKFDYLNFLNLSTNNQYFNQWLENIFKYSSKDNTLPFKYELYLNLLSRFNSEKLLLRQSIEACQTNEELNSIIRSNSLNHMALSSSSSSSGANSGNAAAHHLDKEVITSLAEIDSIFSPDSTAAATATATAMPVHQRDDQNSEIAGILYKLGGQGKQGWHKEWVVLSKGQLIEYSDWRKGKQAINKPIEIALSNIKPSTHDKRKNCFDILTSRGTKHVFQAINMEERDNWIKALYNAGQLVDTTRLKDRDSTTKDAENHSKEKRKGLPGLDVHLLHHHNHQKPYAIKNETAENISPVSILASSPLSQPNIDYIQLIRSKPSNLNNICADCGSTDSVEWVSLNFLTIFCVKCSSGHRALGSHVSRIKSLKLDNFKDETELLLKYASNEWANSYLEETLGKQEKITPTCSDEERTRYIKNKYLQKSFIRKYESIEEVNDLLVKGIQKIDIPNTVKYIGSGADINLKLSLNINKHDFIKVTLLEYSLRKYIEVGNDTTAPRKLFVISELLVLNGCNVEGIEETNTKIGLTPEAIEWWKQRLSKLSGK